MKLKRYQLPDLLKGFAVFLIVPVHIMETFIDYPGRESLLGKSLLLLGGPVAVPVFMMVMGYFVAISSKSIRANIFRGVKLFILGFFLNIGLNFNLLLKIKYEGWQYNPLEYIFGVDIFYLAGLSIIILSILKRIKTGQVVGVILIFVIAGATSFINEFVMVANQNYILPFIGGKYSWSYFPLFPWLVYPLIGFFFQNSEHQIMKFVKQNRIVTILIAISIFTFVVVFSKFGFLKTINLSEYYHHTFSYFLWGMGVIILWILLLRYLGSKFSDFPVIVFLRWLGKNITVFYVIQWLIIGNIATTIYQTKKLSEYGYWFGGIFLITVGLTYFLERSNNILLANRK